MPASIKQSALARYAFSWLYLAAVCAAEVAYAFLSQKDRTAVLRWASTSVHNLRHDPAAALIASAFFTSSHLLAWPALVALAVFGANHALGNWRTALTCAAAQVVGTLVSEGIVAYRVSHGSVPPADRYLIDVGMSYVVVSAIAVAVLHGGWLARGAAAVDLLLLIFVGQIFAGLGQLQVAAVGHLTAMLTGAVLGSFLIWQRRRRKARALFSYGSVPPRRNLAGDC
jgi:membrane associated rhomboid family serine protease